MYSVYILESKKIQNKTYVGLTIKPPLIRLKEHNSGISRYTKSFLPWRLIYFEQFTCKNCALKREKYLKSGKGFRLRKMILQHQLEL